MMALPDQQARKVLAAWMVLQGHKGQRDLPVPQVLVAGLRAQPVLPARKA